MKTPSMLSLYQRCLNAEYIHTPNGGDYAIELEAPFLYLLFEWSDGREDWHNNLTFFAQKVNPRASKTEVWYAHRGFLRVWRSMETAVTERIANQIQNGHIQTLLCVGYSHGAALALLATEALSRYFGDSVAVNGYGFGSPRVVKGRLPEAVSQRLSGFHTVRNIPDLVTHLPPKAWGYRHIQLQEIGEKGKYRPIEAHTSQAYIQELGQAHKLSTIASCTRPAVATTNASKASADRWVFRSIYPATPLS